MSKHITLHAGNISCKHCAMAITRELTPMQSVSNVQVDVATKTVTFDLSDDAAIKGVLATLSEIGYPATQA
jgi:copper chaperone CopZ